MTQTSPAEPDRRVEPEAFLAGLTAYLAPVSGTPYHASLWEAATDIARFDHYLDVVALHHPLAGARLLDLGTGFGGLLLAALRRGVGPAIGVEVDPRLAALARARLAGEPTGVLLTDGDTVPCPDGSFDLVLSLHVLEHTRSPERYVREAARLLAPGGLLLLACPNRLVPREVHADLPYLPWLPAPLYRRLCRAQAAAQPPGGVRRQYETALLLEHRLSYFDVRDLVREAGLTIRRANTPAFFGVPTSELGAWGQAHPWLALPFRAFNNGLLHGAVQPWVRAHPASWTAAALALLFHSEVLLVAGR
jgi:SAM-dependent methyltransferase